MTGRRGIIGLCLLCALVFSALATSGASAAPAGTTAFTCKESATGVGTPFTKSHCKKADESATGKFRHVEVPQGTTTTITGGNEKTVGEEPDPAILKSTQVGLNVELVSSEVHGHGTMTNKVTAGGEHYIHGEGIITYKKVKVLPVALGCKVEKEEVVTKNLTATSEGQGMKLKFQPKEGTTFATFNLSGCTPAELNGAYTVTGSLKTDEIDGATVKATHGPVTAENLLRVRNQKAGLEGSLTISGLDVAQGQETYTPLSATTVETP